MVNHRIVCFAAAHPMTVAAATSYSSCLSTGRAVTATNKADATYGWRTCFFRCLMVRGMRRYYGAPRLAVDLALPPLLAVDLALPPLLAPLRASARAAAVDLHREVSARPFFFLFLVLVFFSFFRVSFSVSFFFSFFSVSFS